MADQVGSPIAISNNSDTNHQFTSELQSWILRSSCSGIAPVGPKPLSSLALQLSLAVRAMTSNRNEQVLKRRRCGNILVPGYLGPIAKARSSRLVEPGITESPSHRHRFAVIAPRRPASLK